MRLSKQDFRIGAIFRCYTKMGASEAWVISRMRQSGMTEKGSVQLLEIWNRYL